MVYLVTQVSTDYFMLRLGADGESVKRLQQALNQRLYELGVTFAQVTEDGYFGAVTLRAVQYLQCIAFLPVNGTVDLQTWEFIEQGADSLPELCLGAVGAMVLSVQNTMRLCGISIKPDGQFGPVMQDQVRLFQLYNQLLPTGVIGPVTWRRLISLNIGHPESYRQWQGH